MAAAEARGADFPVGMKVLVVDDDPTCLVVLKRMLLECRYDGEQLPRSSPPPLGSVALACLSVFTGREAIDCFPGPIGYENSNICLLLFRACYGFYLFVLCSPRRRCFMRFTRSSRKFQGNLRCPVINLRNL
jgi:hypothetical protein